MSIEVNEFYYKPGENDAEYIKLLKDALERQKQITSKAIAKIRELSKRQWKWIPVTKKLPDNDDAVLVSHSHGVTKAWYNGRHWTSGMQKKIKTVKAWMPLPEPYRPEGDKHE